MGLAGCRPPREEPLDLRRPRINAARMTTRATETRGVRATFAARCRKTYGRSVLRATFAARCRKTYAVSVLRATFAARCRKTYAVSVLCATFAAKRRKT